MVTPSMVTVTGDVAVTALGEVKVMDDPVTVGDGMGNVVPSAPKV